MSEKKPDVPTDIDDMAAMFAAYRAAKKKQAEHQSQTDLWKNNADSLKEMLTTRLDEQGANVGKINGRVVVRYTKFPKSQFEPSRFKEDYPELYEEYSHEIEGASFTPYGDD